MKLLFLTPHLFPSTAKFARTSALFAAITALFFVTVIDAARAQESTTNTNEVYFDPYFTGFGFTSFSDDDSYSQSFGTLSLGGSGGGLPLDDSGEFSSQAVVTYTLNTANINAQHVEKNNTPPFAGVYNNGAEIALYANQGGLNNTPGAAAFRTFTISGSNQNDTARPLQIGDTFTITAYTFANPSAGGRIGISFRDSTTYTDFFSSTDASTEARFQLDNTGGWRIYHNGGNADSGLGSNADRTFVIKITSLTTFDAQIGGTWYRNFFMAASGGLVDSFALYTYGDSNSDVYWKNASLENTGTVEVGYNLASGTFTPGQITDGLQANSSTSASANAVNVGGDAGSQVNFNQNNTYTGTTTVNANATLEAQHANALGSTVAGTTVSSNGALKLFDGTGISFASEALTLNGTGVGGANGALRNEGGDNTWNGTITLGSNSRINANTGGASGSLTIAGNISGGVRTLFIGALGSTVEGRTGGNITISGTISGNGSTQDGITTSVFKDGVGALTLSAANDYAGATLLNQGTILIGNNAAFGTGTLQVHFADFGATKVLASTDGTARSIGNAVNIFGSNVTLGATDKTGSLTFSGNINLGNDTTGDNSRTITTASGTSHTFSGVVSGNTANPFTKTGAGSLTLSGSSANTYVAATTVSGGTLNLNKTAGVNAIAGNLTVNTGATLLIAQSNQVANTSAVTLSGGTIQRGSGVSEVFGNLNLTTGSFLNFGTGTAGTMSFGTYTPSSLLTVNNFDLGNTLTFGSDLTSTINNGSLFSFDNGFTSSWDSGTSTFTITAIPEPSTYVAAAGLLALLLWPVRRRLINDAKSILGLRATGRDRIEAYRNA